MLDAIDKLALWYDKDVDDENNFDDNNDDDDGDDAGSRASNPALGNAAVDQLELRYLDIKRGW